VIERRKLVDVAAASAGFLLAAGAVYLVGVLSGTGLVDDTFIFARCARDLADGLGMRFNPGGEPVEGVTSLAWVGVLAAAAHLGIDVPRTAAVLGSLLAAPAAWLAGVRAGGTWAARLVLTLALACSVPFAYWAGTGMDGALLWFFLVAVALVFVQAPDKPLLLGVALACGVWVRLEVLFLVFPWLVIGDLVLSRTRFSRRRAAALILPAVSAAAVQFAWRAHMFGRLLPNTFDAKVALEPLPRVWHGLRYIAGAGPMLGWGAMAVWCAVVAWRAGEHRLRWLLGTVPLWLGYVIWAGGDHFGDYRFLLPAVCVVAAALACSSRLAGASQRQWVLLAVSAALICAVVLATKEGEEARSEVRLAQSWLKVGRWLKEHEPPGTRIAGVVAGAIPYASGFETFDMLGLVTPTVAREGRVYAGGAPGHQRWNTDALLEAHPDVVVYPTSGRFQRPLWEEPDAIDLHYAYSLWAAVADSRVQRLYAYEAWRLADGTWVEMLRRPGSAGGSAR